MEQYPTLYAGQRYTAALARAGLPMTVRKASDTSRASTTSTTADPELTFEVEANGVYVWWAWLKYFADPTGDLTIDFTIPTGALGEWSAFGAGSGTTTTTTLGYSIRTESNDVSQPRNYYGTSDANHTLMLNGIIRVSTTAGTYSLDWAQGTSSVTATTLFTDSWWTMQRIA